MGGLITTAELARLLPGTEALAAPHATADTWYLGAIGVHLHQPLFRASFFTGLSPEAHFRPLPFTAAEVGFAGIAIVFHQFTRSRFSETPEQHLAGWVPPDRAVLAAAWIDEGNRRIRAHLGPDSG